MNDLSLYLTHCNTMPLSSIYIGFTLRKQCKTTKKHRYDKKKIAKYLWNKKKYLPLHPLSSSKLR